MSSGLGELVSMVASDLCSGLKGVKFNIIFCSCLSHPPQGFCLPQLYRVIMKVTICISLCLQASLANF